jgi:hypothetical protein
VIRAGFAVAKQPRLWSTAVRQMRRTAPAGWWKRRPFLPVPSGEYLKFRLLTQYGDAGHTWEPDDVVNYLSWCRSWERES